MSRILALLAFMASSTLFASATNTEPEKWFENPPGENDWRTRYAILCQDDIIDPADTALAYQTMRDFCDAKPTGPKIHERSIKTFRSGDVHAFICSWGGVQSCSSLEFSYFDYWSGNTSVCIEDHRSWIAQHPYWKKAWGVVPRWFNPMDVENLCLGKGYIVDLDVADAGPHEKPLKDIEAEKARHARAQSKEKHLRLHEWHEANEDSDEPGWDQSEEDRTSGDVDESSA